MYRVNSNMAGFVFDNYYNLCYSICIGQQNTEGSQMAYTFDSNIVSDLHKDARGFRPTEYFWEEWDQYTGPDQCGDDNRQMIWDSLCKELEETMTAEQTAQANALANFKTQIREMRKLGAETDRQAIKWIFHAEKMDRYDLQYGADYVAYHFGMSYQNPYKAVIEECCVQALAVIEEEAA